MISHEKLALVKGFATPAMVGQDDQGRIINAFADPEDVRRIEAGYGCGNCCAIFYSFQLECPLCRMDTNVSGQRQETPRAWQEHVDERHQGNGRTIAPTFDDAMEAVLADRDVEHVKLSKLRPSKWGRK